MPKKSQHWFLNPWDNLKASLDIGFYRYRDGRIYKPWGDFETIWYVTKNYFAVPRPKRAPGLNVSGAATDADGFALYGQVRVSGVSVIPP